MNQRIVELKKQAWEYTMAVHDGHIVPPLNKEVWPVDKVFDEKFAELIVAECVQVAQPRLTDVGEWAAGMQLVQKRLKQHFGVEE